MPQIDRVKIKLDISESDTSKDGLINTYLEDAADFITGLTNTDSVPDKLQSAQEELAIIALNKQGVEGQTAHSEGGISRTFGDIPESIMKRIRACRKLPR